MGMVIMNGVEYSSSPKDGFPPIIYSDEEREVGVWRDGKPLYQKTISGTTISGGTTVSIPHNITNLGEIIQSSVSCFDSDSGYWRQLNFTYNNGSSDNAWYGGYAITNSNIIFQLGTAISYTLAKWYCTIQYTKTTDVPGSGKYTTYGGQTHHYSNEEKVVGTWFGKPLYERSWKLTMKNHSSHWIDYTECAIPNLKEVCDVYYGLAGVGPRHYSYWDNNATILFNVQTSSLVEFWIGSNNYTGQTLIYTVRYTKTTD